MIQIEVIGGKSSGKKAEFSKDVIRIGRSSDADVELLEDHVSTDHAQILLLGESYIVRDQRSTNGTVLVRGDMRIVLDGAEHYEAPLETGDLLELGGSEPFATLRVTIREEETEQARVVAMRRITELTPEVPALTEDTSRLRALYDAQTRIGAATDMQAVLTAIANAVFALLPKATHTTIVLRGGETEADRTAGMSGYIPVLTAVRGHENEAGKPIPITRSVFRKVITERAAILAADAPRDVGHSDSLMGASIRSTMGIPLWKGDDILGVLQIDNRESAGVFLTHDLEIAGVLAHHASLAVAHARLIQRLSLAEEQLKKENAFLKRREESRRTGGRAEKRDIVGQSSAILQLNQHLEKVVNTRVTVLIEGETGTGKELVAAAVHYRSRRRDKLFVVQNCAAMPENLLESELFGHKKGAFTGAVEEKKGLFEIADGGTLFLDEVTEMPLSLQSKLLRVLQEGEIRPVGATQERRIDVRIVAATNRDLDKEVAGGRFREDLYYRLKVFPIRVPPLRERRDDIHLLANFFLKRFGTEFGRPAGGFSQQTMEVLEGYDWPGNVRELENEVQRLVIQIEPGGFITPDLLSPRVKHVEGLLERIKPAHGSLKERMDQIERWLLIECLREHENNKTAAARSLGITREGLHKKLKGFGL